MAEYIKREDALNEIHRFRGYIDEDMEYRMKTAINKISSADVAEVRRGKWERDSDGIPNCSCCEETALQRILLRFPKPEYVSHFVLSNFCPNCGCAMEGTE